MSEYVIARLKVKHSLWRRLKAEAILQGVSVAQLVGSILERHTMQCNTGEKENG
jgi:predicted HicB family RNase H-like nuclease